VSVTGGLALGAALLLGNAFFVAAEFAVISARRSQIEPAAEQGSRRARSTLRAMEGVTLILATAQLGITVCSLGLGAVAEPAIAHLLEGPFEAIGLPAGLVHPLAYALGLAVVVSAHVVIGEMVPKNLALAAPDRSALLLAPMIRGVSRAVHPVVIVLNTIANLLLRLVGVTVKDEVSSAFTLEEVASIVTESRREGLIADEHGLLEGALEFSSRVAADVMVPLERLVTVTVGTTPAGVEDVVARTGFSRFPMVTSRDGLDARSAGASEAPDWSVDTGPEVVGYLHIKDILYADDERYTLPVPEKRIRALVSVPDDEEVEDALTAMRRSGSHLARVVAGSGRTMGVLFLEDVVEELVGEVIDATQRSEGLADPAAMRRNGDTR
jgi:CBS domain containing-hemolysin-like protein